jgi:hypothetical protein
MTFGRQAHNQNGHSTPVQQLQCGTAERARRSGIALALRANDKQIGIKRRLSLQYRVGGTPVDDSVAGRHGELPLDLATSRTHQTLRTAYDTCLNRVLASRKASNAKGVRHCMHNPQLCARLTR